MVTDPFTRWRPGNAPDFYDTMPDEGAIYPPDFDSPLDWEGNGTRDGYNYSCAGTYPLTGSASYQYGEAVFQWFLSVVVFNQLAFFLFPWGDIYNPEYPETQQHIVPSCPMWNIGGFKSLKGWAGTGIGAQKEVAGAIVDVNEYAKSGEEREINNPLFDLPHSPWLVVNRLVFDEELHGHSRFIMNLFFELYAFSKSKISVGSIVPISALVVARLIMEES